LDSSIWGYVLEIIHSMGSIIFTDALDIGGFKPLFNLAFILIIEPPKYGITIILTLPKNSGKNNFSTHTKSCV